MILHRRVYLIGLAAALLTAAFALVSLVIVSSADDQAHSLVQRDTQLDVLAASQRDVISSQLQFSSAMSDPLGSASRRALFVEGSAQQQRGLGLWDHFKRMAGRRISTSKVAKQLDTDLRTLPLGSTAVKSTAHDTTGNPPPKSGASASSSRSNSVTPAMVAVPALHVSSDFDAVRGLEYRWWSAQLTAHRASIHRGMLWMILACALTLPGILGLLGSLARAARLRDVELAERDRDLARVAKSNEFEARLQRALELAPNEDGVYGVVEQALDEMVPDLKVEMLLADSSRAHFQQMVKTGSDPIHRCSVDSPTACPAAQRGEVLTFESNRALDACPYLKLQSSPCSATCVPVSVSGLTVGVVHAAGEQNAPPDAQRRTALELISRRASDRIGMMRAFSDSEVQASTDPLTGLSNRRSLETSLHRLNDSTSPLAVVFGDLDHFKSVNDKYGHAAGDHALRVFSRVLSDQLRPNDIFGRYGGEEFLIVLPECDENEAIQVLERVRIALAVTLVSADCPTFTVSFGVAMHTPDQTYEQTIGIADKALLEAKRQGRDRIVVAAEPDTLETDIREHDTRETDTREHNTGELAPAVGTTVSATAS